MRLKTTLLAIVAVVFVAAAAIAPAGAYFTDSSTANGGIPIYVSPSTTVKEWFTNQHKYVEIANSADATAPVFVRARVYSSLGTEVESGDSAWTLNQESGWYEYATPLAPGDAADILQVRVEFPAVQSDEAPEGAVFGDNYNVIVVYESTPVLYDEAGNAYANWDFVLDSGN